MPDEKKKTNDKPDVDPAPEVVEEVEEEAAPSGLVPDDDGNMVPADE